MYLDLGDTGDPELGWDTFHPLPGLQDGGFDFVTISVKDLGLVVETLVTSGTVTISVILTAGFSLGFLEGWDPDLSPSSWEPVSPLTALRTGVTSRIGSSCTLFFPLPLYTAGAPWETWEAWETGHPAWLV